MKKLLLIAALSLMACSEEKKEEHVKVIKHVEPPPPVPVIPVATNPFEKPPPPPPKPVHEPFLPPHWEQVGEFKMNDTWSIWTWRDSANHNTCYIYTTTSGHGMSCVKE